MSTSGFGWLPSGAAQDALIGEIDCNKKYKAHDEANEYNTGDTVELVETHPLSRQKRWRVSRLIERGIEI